MISLRTHGIRLLQALVPQLELKSATDLGLKAAKRFLLLQYETALGTAVTSTPLYEALRKAVPDASITVACSGIPYEVLKYNQNIDQVLRTPHPATEWVRTVAWYLARLRNHRGAFDCVILDSGNRRLRYAFLALLCGARRRVGFDFPSAFHHESLFYDEQQSIIANNLRLTGLLGHRWEPTEPSISFSESECHRVETFFREQRIAEGQPVVALQTQTSGGEPNQWSGDRFQKVARNLCQQWNAQVIFVGTADERDRIDSICKGMRSASCSAAGQTDIPTLAALLSRCDLLVTLDTGTMHVGRAVGVPMVVIAHAKGPAHEWLPLYQERYRIVRRADGACRRCGNQYCSSSECMDQISSVQVLEAIGRQLTKFPPSPDARRLRTSRGLQTPRAGT